MKHPKHKYLLLFFDWLIINYSLSVAFGLQIHQVFNVLLPISNFFTTVSLFLVIYSFVVLFIFDVNGLYRINVYLTITKQFQAIFKSLIYSVFGLAIILFFVKLDTAIDNRLIILYYFLIGLVLQVTIRILVFRTLYRYILFSILPLRKILIIGAEGKGIHLAKEIKQLKKLGLRIVGFIDDKLPIGSRIVNGYKVLGKIENLSQICDEMNVNEVIFCLENMNEGEYLRLIENCSKLRARVLIAADKFSVIPKYVKEEYYGDVPVISVLNGQPYMGWIILKRIIDIVLSLFGLIILSPLFLIVSVAIKLDSKGPVLYKQKRIGRNGKPFIFYKFRSMYIGSDADKSRVEKLRKFINEDKTDDPSTTKIVETSKITRIGKFIRKTSIDELPQLINVLKGEMSLVGPRPCLPYEWQNYAEWHKKRLSVTPGCTGLWQVSGRSMVGFRDMTILDLYYIYNVSFHFDLLLILKTIPIMLFGTGGK